jgi:hypothetical protein
LKRWNVRAQNKDWSQSGPDLLRRKSDAIAEVLELAQNKAPYCIRTFDHEAGQWRDWRDLGGLGGLRDELESSMPRLAQIGAGPEPGPFALIRFRGSGLRELHAYRPVRGRHRAAA